MKRTIVLSLCLIFSLTARLQLNALDYTEISNFLADSFFSTYGSNEGTTSFRSLLIPIGGRAESLGSSYTGLSDDVSYIDYNPAASSINKESEIALFHNAWIADSAIETIAGTTRFGNLGIGGKVSCFYVPFSEYDSFGTKLTGSYYSETTAVLNVSYNFSAGYTFKGLAAGLNVKAAWRSIPDYCDNDTGEIISGSGLEQSALGLMADAGIMMQFNIGKFYISRDPNVRIGLSASNLGAAITGFKSDDGLKLDDGLPSSIGIGISYKCIRPLTMLLEFRQPFDLTDISSYQMFSAGTGAELQITDFFSVLTGFQLKGGNPRISLGSEFEFFKMRMNVNYTLDLTSSLNPVNHISLSAKLLLGDRGREEKQRQVDRLYNEGVACFAKRDFEKAIEYWEEALKIDRHFDPAKTGIKNARQYAQMLEEYSF